MKYWQLMLIATAWWTVFRCMISQRADPVSIEASQSNRLGWKCPCSPMPINGMSTYALRDLESRDTAVFSIRNDKDRKMSLEMAKDGKLSRLGLREDSERFHCMLRCSSLRKNSLFKRSAARKSRILRKLYSEISDEFQVNTSTDGGCYLPFVLFSDNTKVVFWSNTNSGIGIRGQLFNSDWSKNGDEFEVMVEDISNPIRAAVLASGYYVVCWRNTDYDLIARIFDKNISQGAEFQVNTSAIPIDSADILALDDGGFAIVFSLSGTAVVQLFDYQGRKVGSEVTIVSSGEERGIRVARLTSGNIVLVWHGSTGSSGTWDIYAQIFDSQWSTQVSEILVNTEVASSQYSPHVAALKDGGFVVTWESDGQDGDRYGAFAQIFDSSGNKLGSEFQVNQNFQNGQYPESITGLNDGSFIISFYDRDGNDGDGYGVFARQFDRNGNPVTDEFQVNQYSNDSQDQSELAATECGFIVIWRSQSPTPSNYNIVGRVYTDSYTSLAVSNPLQDLNVYNFQDFSFIVPVDTFYNPLESQITYSARVFVDGVEVTMDSFWLSFDPTSRALTGTPSQEQTITVQIVAFEICGSVYDEFQITVASNFKPVVNALIPNQPIPFSIEEIWEYYVPKNAFKDPEGDAIVFTSAVAVINGEEKDLNIMWETLDFDTHHGKLYGIPNLSGHFTIRIYVDDGKGDPNPISQDMTAEILSQGIESLELYQISQRGFKGFISSDNLFFWIAEGSDLKRFDLSSDNPLLINGPSLQYSFSFSVTALAPLSQNRIAIGDYQGNVALLSSSINSQISTISVNEPITDIFNEDDDFIYVSHGSSLSTIRLTTDTLELSRTDTLTKPITSIAKTADTVYAGTQDGLFRIDTLTNTSNDLGISNLGYVYDLQIFETYLYVLGEYILLIFDASNPSAIEQVNTRALEGLGTSLLVLKIDNDAIVFVSEGNNGVNLINTTNLLNLYSEGYYSSISTVNSICVSSTGRWGVVLKESEVYTLEIFRRNIQLQVCDTGSDPCSHELEIQAEKEFSKDLIVSEFMPTFKTDFIYSFSYSYSVLEVSGSVYNSAPEWLSFSKLENKVFRLTGQVPERLIGSVVDLELQVFAFDSDGEKLLTLKKVVSLSVVPRHASLGSSIPDQSLQVGEEWNFSFAQSVFPDADDYDCKYYIDSEWIQSYDISFIRFTSSSRQWHISLLESTKENFFGCDPCNSTEYSTTYVFNITAKNSASDSDPGVSTSFNLHIYSGKIPDQQTHPGISETIVLDESIFPSGISYTVSLLDTDSNSQDLPWWMSYISNERKILMFPTVSEIGQDFSIQISGNNNGAELTSQFTIQVRNEAPVVVKQLQNQRVKLGHTLDYSFPSDTFSDSDGDSLSYTVQWKKADGTLTTAIPSWITFSENTLTFYGSPSTQESYSLLVSASDGLGGQASTEFVVEAYNNLPLLNTGSSLKTQIDHHIGLLFSLTLSSDLFIDADGDSLSYSALQSDGSELPSWLMFNPSTLFFSGTPSTSSLIGTSVSVQITASDEFSSSSTSFTITITNSVPQAGTIENQSVHIGTLYSYTLPSDLFTDQDGDTLVYTASLVDGSSLPSWLRFSSAVYQISGTPSSSTIENTTLDIRVSVSDGYSEAHADFSLSVSNSHPALTYSLSSQIQLSLSQGFIKFKPGVAFEYILSQNTFTDSDSDVLTYSSRLANGDPLPEWLSFDPNTQQFFGTPTQAETLSISVTASDGYGSAVDTFDMNIINQLPTLNKSLQSQFDLLYSNAFDEGFDFSFQFSADTFTDQDDSLTYSAQFRENEGEWRSLEFSWIELEGRTLSGSVVSASISNSTMSLQVAATDGQQTVSDTLSFTILSPFPSPSAKKVHIESVKDSIEVEVYTNSTKLAVFNYGTISALDTSNNAKTHWKIEGSPSNINYVLERLKYRPTSGRLLSESTVTLKKDGLEQEYPLSVFTSEKSIVSSSIPGQKAYIDNSFSMGVQHFFSYSDESELTYSFIIEEKPEKYRNWLNFEATGLSGISTDSDEIGWYKIRVTATDEFDESASEIFDLELDYTQFQVFIMTITLILKYVGPTITGLGLFVYRSKIYNILRKYRKVHAPLLLRDEENNSRSLLILRPDEEEMAFEIFKKLPNKTELDEKTLIADIQFAIKELNMKKSKEISRVRSTIYEESPISPTNEFEEMIKHKDAPIVKIRENKYHARFLFFCIKDYMYNKILNKSQKKELNHLIEYLKKDLVDKHVERVLTEYDYLSASKWVKCKDSWTIDIPDLTSNLTFNCDEVTAFFTRSNSEIDPEIFFNRVRIEQWKDRAVRIEGPSHLRNLRLYHEKPLLCKLWIEKAIEEWVHRNWFSIAISNNELLMQIDLSKIRVTENLYVRIHDRQGYTVCEMMILPTSKLFNTTFVEENPHRRSQINRLISITL